MASPPEKPADRGAQWRELTRSLVLALVVVGVVLGSLFAYARTWPPMVAVESSSMQHAAGESAFGPIDTGDLVIVQAVTSRTEVVTYLEGRAAGYLTYGDYGDVLVFRDPLDLQGTAFIHRALAYVAWNETLGGYDVPDLGRLNASEWEAWGETGLPTTQPYALSRFLLHRAGWRQDLDVHVNLTAGDLRIPVNLGSSGFLTMGDRNAYTTRTKFDRWVVPPPYILGKARGEIPWFGLIKLTLLREGAGCCDGWGSTDPDTGAAANSWLALDLVLVALVGIPAAFTIVEFYLGRHPGARERVRAAWSRLWRRTSEPPQAEAATPAGQKEGQGREQTGEKPEP